jgi:membrane protein involved in D-alanine export
VIPYTNFIYFLIALVILLPALVFGVGGRFRRTWIVAASLVMLTIQYWTPEKIWGEWQIQGIWLVLGFGGYELALASSFLRLRRSGPRRWAYYGALTLGLLPLAAAKFIPLFNSDYGLGFLGLSYITFRCLDVIFGIQDGLIQRLTPIQYLSFLLVFPPISSGPIDRYKRFETDWERERTRSELLQDLDGAVQRIFNGFLYKYILAALIKTYWLDPAAGGTGFWPDVSYMYAYSFYLFFDFAGYSAFAIGFSYMLGVHTPENFNQPFLASNIRDFWNRWHISLSWWFRDHVYSRFLMAALKGHWFKSKYTASYLGLILAFGLMGMWHGTAWHYIAYGLYHGGLMVGYEGLSRWNKEHKLFRGSSLIWKAASIITTFNLACFGFLIFSGRLF